MTRCVRARLHLYVCVGVFSPLCPNFLSLDWRSQDLFPPALKNTFHFNVAAARKVICHLIMTEQTQRHVSVKCVCVSAWRKSARWGGRRRPWELRDLFELSRHDCILPSLLSNFVTGQGCTFTNSLIQVACVVQFTCCISVLTCTSRGLLLLRQASQAERWNQ